MRNGAPPPHPPSRTIRTRVLLAFLLSLVASATALGHNFLQLQAIGRNLAVLDRGYLPLARVAAELEAVARQLDREQERVTREPQRSMMGLRASSAFASGGIAESVAAGHKIIARMQAADDLDESDQRALLEAASILDAIDEERLAVDAGVVDWARAVESDPQGRAVGKAQADLDARRTVLILRIGQLGQVVDGRVALLSRMTSRAQGTAARVSGALAMLTIALSGLLAAAAIVVLRPIGELSAHVQRLTAGDYSGRVPVRGDDEVTVLAREFNAMADAIGERDRHLQERARALDELTLRLRSILDTLSAGIVVTRDDTATVVNPAASALWEVGAGDVLPEALRALPPGRHDALSFRERLFDVSVVPFGNHGRLVVGEDITQREFDRARLARSARLAVVGQMLAQITHEVRNPLNAMTLNSDLLLDELEDPEQRSMMETIANEIRRLERVTGRYLELSREREPAFHSIDLRALVDDVLKAEGPAFARAGVRVRVLGPRPGPRAVDEDTVRRAVRNLLRNAVEAGATAIDVIFSFSTEPSLRGGATADPGNPPPDGTDADTLTLAVRDNGPGMAPDVLRRAFDPFFTTKATGTGLGLAIARQELEVMGATVEVESTEGEGCTFTLSFPPALDHETHAAG